MDAPTFSQNMMAGQPLSATDCALLRAALQRLRQARLAGTLGMLLHGRHMALMAPDGDAARLFRQAGTELGAQVALVTQLAANASPTELHTTGRMLGQLYDAVDCLGMPTALVRSLAQATTVPVFDSLAGTGGRALAAQLALEPDDSGDGRLLVQAVLLSVVN